MSDEKPTTTNANGWPCGWPEPELDYTRGRGCVVAWESLGQGVYFTLDEALVIGKRLVELVLKAEGGGE